MKYLMLLLSPVLLVALVLVAPLALCYFLFDRLCDLIEYFRPSRGRRAGSKRSSRAAQLGKLFNLIPVRGSNDNKGGERPAQPPLPGK